jgi:hypothetical protein
MPICGIGRLIDTMVWPRSQGSLAYYGGLAERGNGGRNPAPPSPRGEGRGEESFESRPQPDQDAPAPASTAMDSPEGRACLRPQLPTLVLVRQTAPRLTVPLVGS